MDYEKMTRYYDDDGLQKYYKPEVIVYELPQTVCTFQYNCFHYYRCGASSGCNILKKFFLPEDYKEYC